MKKQPFFRKNKVNLPEIGQLIRIYPKSNDKIFVYKFMGSRFFMTLYPLNKIPVRYIEHFKFLNLQSKEEIHYSRKELKEYLKRWILVEEDKLITFL